MQFSFFCSEEVPRSVLWQNGGAKPVTAVSGGQPCLRSDMCSCAHVTFLCLNARL